MAYFYVTQLDFYKFTIKLVKISRGIVMLNFFKDLWQHDSVKFITRTVFYFAVLVVLLYLYDYSGMTGGTFIYNEF